MALTADQQKRGLLEQGLDPEKFILLDMSDPKDQERFRESRGVGRPKAPRDISPIGKIETQESSPFKAGGKAFINSLIPSSVGAIAGNAAASFIPGRLPIKVGAAMVAGITAGVTASFAQEAVIEKAIGVEAQKQRHQTLARERKDFPMATLMGEVAGVIPVLRPSISSFKQVGQALKKFTTSGAGLTLGEKAAVFDSAIGATAGATIESGMQIREGKFDIRRIIGAGLGGATFNTPTPVGRAAGLKMPVEEVPRTEFVSEAGRPGLEGLDPVIRGLLTEGKKSVSDLETKTTPR
ncbi:MAG: hypothetical protein V3T23_06210, partial [Nitrososphaerales archaeon]